MLPAVPPIHYYGQPEFGLPLVTPAEPDFAALVREILSLPEPFGKQPPDSLERAAVLRNQSGRAIVFLSYVWRYTTAQGHKFTSRCVNLGSSIQTDYLTGRTGLVRDLGHFILPGSKRLITEDGIFGNNLDVLPAEAMCRGGGIGGGGRAARRDRGEVAEVELTLDVAVLEDGLCVGPDEFGLYDNLVADLDLQRATARQIAESLRAGASPGQIFEALRPLARRGPGAEASGGPGRAHTVILHMFANSAIHRLVNTPEAELTPWFERIAEATPLGLHRP
jgi:hypothetical protein